MKKRSNCLGIFLMTMILVTAASMNGGVAAAPPIRTIGSLENQSSDNPVEYIVDRTLQVHLPYVNSAEVAQTKLMDIMQKTMLVDLVAPSRVLSTLKGFQDNVITVGNHAFPPPCWPALGDRSIDEWSSCILKSAGRNPDQGTVLLTGANMDHLSVEKAESDGLLVYALVTAGVKSNAMRSGQDIGDYVEPGTINIIVLTNRQLTDRAMTRALITITEAKTAALQDLDIRSAYHPKLYQATGTGTDNVIVVQGDGSPLDLTGGHTRMGELIARAVYAGVRETLAASHGLIPERNVFQRLEERRIYLEDIINKIGGGDPEKIHRLRGSLEGTLLEPEKAGLVEMALAIEDARQRGLIGNMGLWDAFCRTIAGQDTIELEALDNSGNGKSPLYNAIGALATAEARAGMLSAEDARVLGKTPSPGACNECCQ